MQVFAIPIDDQYIIYRPLLRLAFLGNAALADLIMALAADECMCQTDIPDDIHVALESIGFFEPDPPPPPPKSFDIPQSTSAVILLTNRCNLRCTYCYANAGVSAPRDVSLELARPVIDQACQNALDKGQTTFRVVFHGGGEPTQAWAAMKAITNYARSKPLRVQVSMVSNGVWSAQQTDWVLDNINSLTLSIDGGPSTQDAQRPLASGHGSFKYVKRTIEALDAAGFEYGLRLTATEPWRERLPEDVRLLCEISQARSLAVEPAFNIKRGGHAEPNEEEQDAFVDAFMAAYEIARQAGRRLRYSGARPETLTSSFCASPFSTLTVTAEGDLVGCFEVSDSSHPLADMMTVGKVINDQLVVDHEARDRLINTLNQKPAEHCQDCFCQWQCGGDCFARTTIRDNGTYQTLFGRCHINRDITKHLLLWHIMDGDGVWRGQSQNGQQQSTKQRAAALG